MKKILAFIFAILLLSSPALAADLFDQEELGSELHTSANAASDPNGNEANGTTGWTDRNGNLASVASPVSTGSYALSSTTSASTGGFNVDMEATWGISAGTRYKLTFDIRHTGSGLKWQVAFSNNSFSMVVPIKTVLNSDTTYQSVAWYFLYDGVNKDLIFREDNASDNGGVYVDNLSLTTITTPAKGLPDDSQDGNGSAWPAVAGSELLTNGDCSADSFTKGTGWAHDGANEEYDCDGSQVADSDLTQNVITGAGLHKVESTVSNYSAGNICGLADTAEGTDVSANGSYEQYIYADSAGVAGVRGDADFVGSVDDVSVRPVQLSWVPTGTNTLEIDETTDAIKITYGNTDTGATLALSNAADLTADLTPGHIYRFSCNAKVSTGSADIEIADASDNELATETLTTSFADYEIYFVASHATTNKIQLDNLSASEAVSIRDMTLEDVTDEADLLLPSLVIAGNDTTISYSIINCGGTGTGIKVLTGVTGTKIYNCVIDDCTNAIELVGNAEVKNVIFEDSITNDIYENPGTATTATNYASADGDPLFVNEGTDYSLKPGSPAINAGTNAVWSGTASVTDYAGTPITDGAGAIVARGGTVDIGAIEYLGGAAIMIGF